MRSFGSFPPSLFSKYSCIHSLRQEEYSVMHTVDTVCVHSFTLVSSVSPSSCKRCNKRNFLKCSWIHYSLIFQNHLVGFCSSSVLPTDCTEKLAIALRDIPVVQHHPSVTTVYTLESVLPLQTKAHWRDHSEELCYTVRSSERKCYCWKHSKHTWKYQMEKIWYILLEIS